MRQERNEDVQTDEKKGYAFLEGTRLAAAASRSNTAPVTSADNASDPAGAILTVVVGTAARPSVPATESVKTVSFTTVRRSSNH